MAGGMNRGGGTGMRLGERAGHGPMVAPWEEAPTEPAPVIVPVRQHHVFVHDGHEWVQGFAITARRSSGDTWQVHVAFLQSDGSLVSEWIAIEQVQPVESAQSPPQDL